MTWIIIVRHEFLNFRKTVQHHLLRRLEGITLFPILQERAVRKPVGLQLMSIFMSPKQGWRNSVGHDYGKPNVQ